jgi:hypothetical protein
MAAAIVPLNHYCLEETAVAAAVKSRFVRLADRTPGDKPGNIGSNPIRKML